MDRLAGITTPLPAAALQRLVAVAHAAAPAVGASADGTLLDPRPASARRVGLQTEPAWTWDPPCAPPPERAAVEAGMPVDAETCAPLLDAEDRDAGHAELLLRLWRLLSGQRTAAPELPHPLRGRTMQGVDPGALCSESMPPALRSALEQWRSGRSVVLACPQGDADGNRAWAFVLQPRTARTPSPALPALHVRCRVDAWLRWSAPSNEPTRWCLARMVKDHHPRRGRQLVPLDPPGCARAPLACRVQLGALPADEARPSRVLLRIDDVHRFWPALEQQWGVHVVVCSAPLVALPAAGGTPCR